MIDKLAISIRFVIGSALACAVVYPALVWAAAAGLAPDRAHGSLVRGPGGEVVGSRLLAQEFERPEYLWPRPSAVDYDAAAAGGSNLAPSNPALRRRAASAVANLHATGRGSIPAELVAASGSGLDPHITLFGALYQVQRIAHARGVRPQRVEEILRHEATADTPWSPALVNVLETNLALDRGLGRTPDHPPP